MATARVVFKGPGPQVNGLQARPEGLWVCDQVDNKIYLITYNNGAIINSFDTPARNLSGITYGDGGPWGAANVRPGALRLPKLRNSLRWSNRATSSLDQASSPRQAHPSNCSQRA